MKNLIKTLVLIARSVCDSKVSLCQKNRAVYFTRWKRLKSPVTVYIIIKLVIFSYAKPPYNHVMRLYNLFYSLN